MQDTYQASRMDHLVYATPSLEDTTATLQKTLGVRAAQGGRYPGRGTRNALVALSDTSYLAIIGPDETAPDPPRWFGIESIAAPRLVTWALRTSNIDQTAAEAERRGIRLGPIIAGSRETADGRILRWRYTDPAVVVSDGIVPFLIDWGDSPHPAKSAPRGPDLAYFRAEHPNAFEV